MMTGNVTHHSAPRVSMARCLLVWVAATTAAAPVLVLCASAARAPWLELVAALSGHAAEFDARGGPGSAALLLTSTLGIAACLRLWGVVTSTCWRTARGLRVRGGGLTRRLTLAACGIALTAIAVAPAHAAGTLDGLDGLDGLSLPDRPVAGAVHEPEDTPHEVRRAVPATVEEVATRSAPEPRPKPAPPSIVEARRVTVAQGDSLWGIARATLRTSPATGATHPPSTAEVADLAGRLHEANTDVIGDDPDLILPGQQLALPQSTDHQPTEETR